MLNLAQISDIGQVVNPSVLRQEQTYSVFPSGLAAL